MGRRELANERLRVALALLALGCVAGLDVAAQAQASSPLEREADGFCRHVEGVAASRAAVLYAPRARVSIGTTRSDAVAVEDGDTGPPRARFLAGIEYDFIDLYRASTIDAHAQARCAAYRAEIELREALGTETELESAAALRARLSVLEEALPRAQSFVRELEAEVAAGQATLTELSAVERELDALELERIRARFTLESLPAPAPRIDGAAPDRLFRRYAVAEAEVERYEARLRTLEAFNVALHGGYDHVFAEPLDPPVYGMLTLSYAFGGLMQPHADAQAAAARKAWIQARMDGAHDDLERTKVHAAALLNAERSRLAHVEQRLQALEARQDALANVSEGRAREYARALWLELVRVRAERAYLQQHVSDLAAPRSDSEASHAR